MFEKIVKAYDIRGIYPEEINEEAVERLAKAYAEIFKPKKVAVGRDVRDSGESLKKAVIAALTGMGVDVVDIGTVTTDMLYFAVAKYGLDGGLGITASHNPAEYNGIKVVREEARPVSLETGLAKIRDRAEKGGFEKTANPGTVTKKEIIDDYIEKLFEIVNVEKIKPMKVVVNPNFGAAIPVIESIGERLNLELVKLNFEEDGSFPKGKPDPSLPENQTETSELITSSKADVGTAWDADADRCFLYDENGQPVNGYYLTAILAKIMLKNNRHQPIIHDPRLVWATRDVILEAGGVPLMNKVGHSFIKERMRQEDALFAGENSGHFYFKDFYYCDNGMLPFLLMLSYISENGIKLSEIVQPFMEKYPTSGEINFKVPETKKVLDEIREKYKQGEFDDTDGISVDFGEWRFNVRSSNTEPLLRLNVEAKSKEILDTKVTELTNLIEK
jgi:phosphomannomutase